MQKVLLRTPSSSSSSTPASASSSAPARGGPYKLVGDTFELLADELSAHLSDSQDFTVIGVLGGQGSGKSSIMSLLAGASWAASGAEMAQGIAVMPLQEPVFPPQQAETILQATHQTCGVDLYVSPERLILLDAQPILSASILGELQRGVTTLPPDVHSHENLLELHSLRLAMLMLSVCHVVVCVQDEQLDPACLRLLRAAQMLRHRLPDVSQLALATPASLAALGATAASPSSADADSSNGAVEYSPQLAFVFNRMPPSAFAPRQEQTLRAALAKLFPCAPASDAAVAAPDSSSRAAQSRRSSPALFTLPASSDVDPARLRSLHLGFYAEAERMRDALLSLRRVPFAKPLTERDWLRGVGRMWELIRRSAMVADYNRALHKLHFFT
jgi:protein SMG9